MNKFSKFTAIALLLVGVLLAAIALLGTGRTGTPDGNPVQVVSAPQIAVVVAAKDVPAGHVLTAADVSVQNMSSMPSQGFASAALVVGRSTAVELAQGAPVVVASLLDGLSGMLVAGERAVSIKVDEASAVGHKLQPGDWVDVFVVLRRDSQEVDATQARMLLPRKKILAYGAQLQPQPQIAAKKTEEPKSSDRQNQNAARTAVIAVQVEEVNRLLLAEQHGQVLLALRSPLDQHEPSSDKLKQIAGIGVSTSLHQDVNKESAALDSSLTALTIVDLSKVVMAKETSFAKPNSPGVATSRQVRPVSTGASVEMIKGTRKETLRY